MSTKFSNLGLAALLLLWLMPCACSTGDSSDTPPDAGQDISSTDAKEELTDTQPMDSVEAEDASEGKGSSVDDSSELSPDTALLPDASTDLDQVSPQEDSTSASFEGLESGFLSGGIIGRYYDGDLEAVDDEPGEIFFQRLETELSLTKTDDAFGSFNGGELFSAHYEGALYVEKPGVYRLLATASDSVQIKLHGEVVLDVWKAKQLYTAQVIVKLTEGWHPLELIYARDNYRAHLQLWMAFEEEEVELVGANTLGYPDVPPENPAAATITAELDLTGNYSASFHVESDIPVQFSTEVDGVSTDIINEGIFHTTEERLVQLDQGGSYSVVFRGTDPWGREFTSAPLEVETPSVPTYTPGGLLGTYHSDTKFENPVGIRLDPRLHLPQDTDGDKAGCFQSAMPDNNFSVRWEGGLWVETPGDYILYLGSDDGQRLYVDGVLVAHNWAGHALSYVQNELYLGAGWHPLLIELYEGVGSAEIHLEWEPANGLRALVPPENLGSIIPEQPAEPPSILTFTTEASGSDIKAIWTTSKLSKATITILSGESAPEEVEVDNGWEEAKLILEQKCADCHTTGASGGWSTSEPSTIQLDTGSCEEGQIFDCILERIQDGSMPPQNLCTGDPAIDGGADDCLNAEQHTTMETWVANGGGGPPAEPETIHFPALSTGFSNKFTAIPESGFTISLQLEDASGQLSPAQEYIITPPAE